MSAFLKYLVEEDVEQSINQHIEDVAQRIEQRLEQRVKQWYEEHKDIWLQKGEATILISQLEDKFTTLPEHYKRKIETASSHLLLQWGEKILKSQSLEEIFAS